VQALVNNLANPKVILFFAAFLPQFVLASAGRPTVQFLALGALFLLVGLVLDVAIGLLSGRIGRGSAARRR
jgi:threonine/homoserine/homoserine lactone efflux protein